MKDLIKITGSNKKPLPDISQATPPGPTPDVPLNSLADKEPVDLINMLVDEEGNKRQTFPDASIQNRAAYAALLSGQPDIASIYQSIINENKAGEDWTRNAITGRVNEQVSTDVKKGAISLLSDPTILDEQKRQILESLNDGFTKDSATVLANHAFTEPVKGETVEAENVRVSGADVFRPRQEYKQYVQGLINRHEAMRAQDGNAKFFGEFLETLIPYATNVGAAKNITKLAEALHVDASKVDAFLLPGSINMDVSEALKRVPDDKKKDVAAKLYQIIENNHGIILTNDNKFNELEQIKKILDGDYSGWDKLLDNSAGILDTLSLGGYSLLKNGFKRLTSLVARTPEKVAQKVAQRSIVDTTSPIAPMSVLRESNPDKATAALKVVIESKNDEVAKALTGTTREDAIAAEMLPQPAVVDKTVEVKLITPDERIKAASENKGGYELTQLERQRAEANVLKDVNNLTGMKAFDNMTTVMPDGDSLVVRGMYGLPSGGFQNAEEAVKQAKFAFKEYEVADKDFQLYKKIDGEYVPTTLDESKGVMGDYTIGVDFRHKIETKDVGMFDALDVHLNWLDRATTFRTQKAGTAANHLITHASMLHPTITGSASVAVDRAVKIDKLFLEMHSEFSDGFVKLPAQKQSRLYEHLKEANEKGLELSDLELRNKGFDTHEIDLVHKWRKNWDTHFYFENADQVRTLKHQNFHVFEDPAKGNKFFAKPVGKNANLEVYDPSLDQVRLPSRLEMDQLYASGGTYAQFRRPIKINGVTVEHMMVRNTPNEYLRALTNQDQILNYRKGYFQVGYKAPFFVVQKEKAAGKEYWKAVEVAGSTEEAEHVLNRLATSSGKSNVKGVDFDFRNDVRDFRPDTDYYWDLQHASGRVAQRHRGKLLEDATSSIGGFNGKYILDPTESAVRASRSLSERIAMRDMLETHKARAMQQYGDVFPEEMGRKQWVENSNSLVKAGAMDSKHITDARTTVEFINFLQRGYENAIDNGFRMTMNYMANLMSKAGSKHLEQAFLWAKEGRPVEILKNGVFQAYLATNPFRQYLVQSHQAIRLMGYINPINLGKVLLEAGDYLKYTKILRDVSKAPKETQEMIKFVQDSGMLDAIDKHSLTRGSLTDMIETMTRSSNIFKRAAGVALELPRRIGFDAGESTNLIMHVLAVRKKFQSEGRNLADKYVRDEAYSTARALSYDMNRAGDMPYNSNMFGVALQFLQVPHKAVAAVLTNRRIAGTMNPLNKDFYKITANDKLRMFGMDMLLFGAPGATMLYNILPKEVLPEEPKHREAAIFGLTSVAYNEILKRLGATSKTDFSSLSPYGMDGFAHLIESIFEGGIDEFWHNSPSATFYFNENSRMRDAMGRVFSYFGFTKPEEHPSKEDAMSVLKGVAQLSSGWTNGMKMQYILEKGKLYDKQGVQIASDLNWVNAAAQLFGLPPMEVKLTYDAMKSSGDDEDKLKEKVDRWYKGYIRGVARDGLMTTEDPEMQDKVLADSMIVWKHNLKAQQMIRGYLMRDLSEMPDRLMKPALERAGLTDLKTNQDLQNLKILNKDKYDQLLQLESDIRKEAEALDKDK